MKKRNLVLVRAILFGLFLPFVFSCSDDDPKYVDVDGNAPTIALVSDHVLSEPGRQFTIEAAVKDNDGLRSIQVINDQLYLDKTIDLIDLYDELQYEYDLEYNYTSKTDVLGDGLSEESSYTIKIIATDVGGRTSEASVLITMDGDFYSPVFTAVPDNEITVLMKEATSLNLKFTATDNKGIDFVEVILPGYVEDHIQVNGALEYSYQNRISLPSTEATYNLTIRVVDESGLEVVQNSAVNVSELPDFEKMYLADVETAAELNSSIFGIPMLISHTGEYTYQAQYYNKTAGTKIRFIPQKTDFEPITFGPDPDNNSILTDDPEIAGFITLPQANQYYEINFNTKTGEYSCETFTPDADPVAIGSDLYLDGPDSEIIPLQIGLIGGGIPNSGDWDPADPFILTQDSSNPFILYGTFNLEAGNALRFIIGPKHSWGWWPDPYWRWDDGVTPEANVYLGGENPTDVDGGWQVTQTGTYRFEIDTYLLRSKLYLID